MLTGSNRLRSALLPGLLPNPWRLLPAERTIEGCGEASQGQAQGHSRWVVFDRGTRPDPAISLPQGHIGLRGRRAAGEAAIQSLTYRLRVTRRAPHCLATLAILTAACAGAPGTELDLSPGASLTTQPIGTTTTAPPPSSGSGSTAPPSTPPPTTQPHEPPVSDDGPADRTAVNLTGSVVSCLGALADPLSSGIDPDYIDLAAGRLLERAANSCVYASQISTLNAPAPARTAFETAAAKSWALWRCAELHATQCSTEVGEFENVQSLLQGLLFEHPGSDQPGEVTAQQVVALYRTGREIYAGDPNFAALHVVDPDFAARVAGAIAEHGTLASLPDQDRLTDFLYAGVSQLPPRISGGSCTLTLDPPTGCDSSSSG